MVYIVIYIIRKFDVRNDKLSTTFINHKMTTKKNSFLVYNRIYMKVI